MPDSNQTCLQDDLSVNPFRDDVFSPQSQIPGSPQIHQKELSRCLAVISKMVAMAGRAPFNQARGELISISSPLAGYGKSHLIARISKETIHTVTPIELFLGSQISWQAMFAVTLQNLQVTRVGLNSEQTPLDHTASYFIASLVRAAVAQGVIEEKECPVPLSTLQGNYRAAFANHVRPKFLASLKKKWPLIRSRARLSRIEFGNLTRESSSFWADFFLSYLRKDENSFEALKNLSELDAKDRFLQLLHLSSHCRPLLIIADHLDVCHGSQTAGMEIATTLTAISEHVSNSVLIFSVNEDLWASIFKDKLPSALVDRLNRESIELSPITLDEAKELIVNRLCFQGIAYQQSHQFANAVSEDCGWTSKENLHPRLVLRHAKEVWNKRRHEFQPAPEQEKPESDLDTLPPVIPSQTTDPESSADYVPNLFAGPLADRSLAASPIHQSEESISERNRYSANRLAGSSLLDPCHLPSGRINTETLPQPQPNLASENKDEPLSGTYPPGSNGQSPQGTNGQPLPQVKTQAVNPITNYFQQLEKFYTKKMDLLTIDFPTLENFIKTVGQRHAPLTQNEWFITGGENACLHWDLPNFDIWIGFEPARNLSYYCNVLQKLLSDPAKRPGKIVGFTHPSHPFSKDLLIPNGISPEILNQYFDFIQLNNQELVIIYSAAQLLKETTAKGYGDEALKFILKKLNPLWQRLCHPLGGVTP